MNNKQIIGGLLSLFLLASCHSYEYHGAAPCYHAAPPARPIPAPGVHHKASPRHSMKRGPHHAKRIHHHNGAPHSIPQHR